MEKFSHLLKTVWEWLNDLATYMSGNSILSGTIATLLAATFIFLFKEYIKKPPNFSGAFEIECKTLKSAYNPYINLISYYTLFLICDNNIIEGYIEKTRDIENNGLPREYIGKNRNTGEVRGIIKRNYLRSNHASLNIKMHGERRQYTILLYFKNVNTNIMNGKFWSTAADSSGDVKWQRNVF
ncbi:hypothetical protein [Rahnella perminowiae]|uniref:hypothetical protein n=1 Tax=Rahnella perminowiae TaxID=2816244 RepID=UPI00300E74DC